MPAAWLPAQLHLDGAMAAIGAPLLNVDDLRAIILAEKDARTSPAVQALIQRAEDDEWNRQGIFSWLEVIGVIQHALCARFLRWRAARSVPSAATSAGATEAEAFSAEPSILAGDFLRYLAAHPRALTSMSSAADSTDTRWFCRASSTPFGPGAPAGALLTVAQLRSALKQLRTAGQTNPELGALQVYVRANRCTRGPLRNGDLAPDVSVLDAYSGLPTSLHEVVRSQPAGPTGRKKPVMLLAVSYS